MKTFSIKLSSILLCALVLVACTKSKIESPQNSIVKSTKSTEQSYLPLAVAAPYNVTLSSTGFTYFSQGSLTTYPLYGCLPACCVMAAHWLSPSIPANTTTGNAYCVGMLTSTGGTYIWNAYSYLHSYVFTSNVSYMATDTTAVKTNLKTYLNANRPMVALVKYNGASSTPSKTIISTGPLLHWVLVVGLNEGTRKVSYYDPNGVSTLKTVDLTVFLNAMRTAATNCNYMRIGN